MFRRPHPEGVPLRAGHPHTWEQTITDPLAAAFARYYRGRHDPADALWWLTHPAEPGPSSAPPAQRLFLEAADELDADGLGEVATALREALADLLAVDRRAALDALAQAERRLRAEADRSSGDRPRTGS